MVEQKRNWLERLGERIPGYGGYAERERRRDVDKLQREHLAERLRVLKTPLTDVMREMTTTGRLFEIGSLERLVKKLDQIENRVRFAAYGYAGFFDAAKVEEQQLDSLYQFDLALVERVDALAAKVGALQPDAGDFKASVAEAGRALDELNRTFDERHKAIDNFNGGEAAGGRSMFDA
jgi:hypothetical protein